MAGLGLALAFAGFTGRSAAMSPPATGANPRCPALPDAVVIEVDHLGTDLHLGPARSHAAVTSREAIRDDRRHIGKPPVIGARLMTLTSVQYPHGVLVWVIATTPGVAVPDGGPAPAATGSSGASTTTILRHYTFSIDILDAITGKWLQGLEGT